MKKFSLFSLLFAAALFGLPAAAQSICFWTDDTDVVPVRIYIDREYIGDVTAAVEAQPLLDAPGCLSVDTAPGRHDLTAVDKYGRVYKGWTGHIRLREGEVSFQRLRGRQFRIVEQDDYDFVFLDWVPLYSYLDIPYYGFRLPVEELDPLTDDDLLIGMGVAAIGATAAMSVAAARNWGVPDSRFPYVAVGLGTEFLPTLNIWRNVAQFRARFGNRGGVSLLADAGAATLFDYRPQPYSSIDRSETRFTFSVGAGLDYGGFGFSVRYKPAIGDSIDTFLAARVAYDWWVSDNVAINFHGDFGVAGFGTDGLFDHYEFPFGIGVLFRL